MSKVPSFFVIGCVKGGTVAIRDNLVANNHPEIYLPTKLIKEFIIIDQARKNGRTVEFYLDIKENRCGEMDFFCNDNLYELGLDYYKAFFNTDKTLIGDISPNYLYLDENPKTAERIKELVPNAKIVISLRDPITRAYSHWNHFLKEDFPKPKWTEGIIDDNADFYTTIRKNEGARNIIRDRGLYYDNVIKWIQMFGRENVHFIQQEQMKRHTWKVLNNMVQFAGIKKSLNIKNILTRHSRSYDKPIDESSVEYLREFYRDDVNKLKELLPRFEFTLWNNY